MQAKKKFGQNFLIDTTIVDKIIQSMSCENKLIEIGPGLGDLTCKLLEITKVKAYEVDDDLSMFLNTQFSDYIKDGRFELKSQDVLQAWDSGSLEECNYDIVANLPYYIATAIILNALKDEMCKNMTVMIQREVAQKFAALPKQKEFCSLSVLAQSIANVEVLFDVPPSAFNPEPKVVSSVIKFKKFKEYKDIFELDEYKKFEKFLKSAFAQPRKTLMKNLSQVCSKNSLKVIFDELNLPLHVRGHEIDTKTYHCLFKKTTKVIKDERTTNKQGGS